ncbi:MAG: serine/threonine kinase [Labilithrix sp.]|nr:serine/threonine kinase [Labilithrix sp.]
MPADDAPAPAVCVSTFVTSPDCSMPTVVPGCANGMCRIPHGCFVMGSPACEPGRGAYSENELQVTLAHDFLIGQYEVTQAEWVAAGFTNPSRVDHPAVGGASGDCSGPNCPVGHANWYEAAAFANRRSEREGLPACYALDGCAGQVGAGLRCATVGVTAKAVYECTGYRLPSEAEWEYAARAGTRSASYGGSNHVEGIACEREESLDPIAWYCINGGTLSHPIGKKLSNPWGLFDILGNVEEWTSDYFDGLGYGAEPLVDPVGGWDRDAGVVEARTTRGGVFASPPAVVRASARFGHEPFVSGPGLRLARTLAP